MSPSRGRRAQLYRPGKGRGNACRRLTGCKRHHCRVDQRQCRHSRLAARDAGKARDAALARRDGGGQCLPPVLRFRAAALPLAGPPDPCHQPRRKGENAQRDRFARPRAGAAAAAPRRGEARLCRHGFRQSRRRGRLRPSYLPLARARDARFAHRTGRRGRYRSVCAESEAPFDAAAGQGQGDDGA